MITPPEWIPADDNAIGDLRGSGTSTPYEKEYLRRDGTRISVFMSIAMLPGPEEQIAAFVLDITGRKRSETALWESEQRLRRFYESGLFGAIYWTVDGKITDANDTFLRMIGYTRDDLLSGRIDWISMTPPEFRYLDEQSLEELKTTGVNKTGIEKEYIHGTGPGYLSTLPVPCSMKNGQGALQ